MLATSSRRPQSIRLAVNPLECRDVPSATTLDLTHRGSEVEAAGAILRQTSGHGGHTRTFLRLQDKGTEQGYNTDARPLEFDEKNGRNSTRSLTLDQVPVVTIDGVKYREFLLNINQQFWSPYLTLKDLQLYVSPSKTLHGYNPGSKRLGGLAPIFDLDSGGDVSVKMNARLNFWGGRDVKVLVPDAAFAGHAKTDNVYLFSRFAGGNGGFEEWLVRKAKNCQPPEPPPATLGSLSGLVFVDTFPDGQQATGEAIIEEPGLASVLITLRWTNDLGEVVEKTTWTSDSEDPTIRGTYTFTDLQPGTYEIFETQPEGFMDGIAGPGGSLGGTYETNHYSNIHLVAGSNMTGTGYLFGENE